jgi:hypothetical protein
VFFHNKKNKKIIKELDLDREVPALLYIDRGGRVTMRAIRLTDWILCLLHGMRNRLILTIVLIRLSWVFLACLGLHIDRLPGPRGPPP